MGIAVRNIKEGPYEKMMAEIVNSKTILAISWKNAGMSHVDSFGQIYEFGDLNGDHTEGLEKYKYLTSYYIIGFLHPNYFVMKEKTQHNYDN